MKGIDKLTTVRIFDIEGYLIYGIGYVREKHDNNGIIGYSFYTVISPLTDKVILKKGDSIRVTDMQVLYENCIEEVAIY